jgi:hypothetical protein
VLGLGDAAVRVEARLDRAVKDLRETMPMVAKRRSSGTVVWMR